MTTIQDALRLLDYLGHSKRNVFQFLQRYKGVDVKPKEEKEVEVMVPTVIPQIEAKPEVLFQIIDGKVWISSLEIARLFERSHADVLKSVRNMEADPSFTEGNFSLSDYKDSTGRSLPMFMMTKKGYRRLVMDFTGKRASEVKEELLDRFEELEAKESTPAPFALSGDIGEMLIQAGTKIKEQQLVITTLEQDKKLLTDPTLHTVEGQVGQVVLAAQKDDHHGHTFNYRKIVGSSKRRHRHHGWPLGNYREFPGSSK